jgi:hypothetical protein
MSDIFISYAKEDRARAQLFAEALILKGLSVFWDRTILAGSTWRETIGKELESARCVLVLWSPNSVNSDWVLDEADYAKKRKVLLPVLIADAEIPLGFGGVQAAKLSHWEGEEADPDFQKLLGDITGRTGTAAIFPFAEFKADKRNTLKLLKCSRSCMEFYGYAGNDDLSNKTLQELIDNLQSFIDKPHWDEFLKDQAIVYEKYVRGELPLAQIPIRFNGQHPYFPGRTFVPLIIERTVGEGPDITRVLYLDIAQLPKGAYVGAI